MESQGLNPTPVSSAPHVLPVTACCIPVTPPAKSPPLRDTPVLMSEISMSVCAFHASGIIQCVLSGAGFFHSPSSWAGSPIFLVVLLIICMLFAAWNSMVWLRFDLFIHYLNPHLRICLLIWERDRQTEREKHWSVTSLICPDWWSSP